jgi:hypothetical protein
MAGVQYARFGTHNAVLPKEGPIVIPTNLDFSTVTGLATQTIDLSLQIQQGFISYVQGFFVDNFDNTAMLTIVIDETNQRFKIPAGKQAYFPAMFGDSAKCTVSTTQANGLVVPMFLVNFPVDAMIW